MSDRLTFDIEKLQHALTESTELEEILAEHSLPEQLKIFQNLPIEDGIKIIQSLQDEQIVILLKSLSRDFKRRFIEESEIKRLESILQHMESDDVTDLISLATESRSQEILEILGNSRATITTLLAYPKNTAGSLMAKEYLRIHHDATVNEAILAIRSQKKNKNDYHIFVINRIGQLEGVLSFRALMLADSTQSISELMNKPAIAVNVMASLKEIISLEQQYDLPSIPVIDDNTILLGRITFDDIMDVLDEQSLKNIFRSIGLKEYKIQHASLYQGVMMRIPWLLLGLLGGVGSALVFQFFQESLVNTIFLTFFTPVIMSMGGTIGIQASTVMLSYLMSPDASFVHSVQNMLGELKYALITGFLCSICFFGLVAMWQGPRMGGFLFLALFLIMNTGAMIGTVTPVLLQKLHINPVLATGPFIAIMNDITALILYFSLSLYFYA